MQVCLGKKKNGLIWGPIADSSKTVRRFLTFLYSSVNVLKVIRETNMYHVRALEKKSAAHRMPIVSFPSSSCADALEAVDPGQAKGFGCFSLKSLVALYLLRRLRLHYW